MGTTSQYVLDRRLDPSLRDETDYTRMKLSEMKRNRKSRKENETHLQRHGGDIPKQEKGME
jgi:hypothetical protein